MATLARTDKVPLFLLRSGSVVMMLLLCVMWALFEGSDGFSNWDSNVIRTLPALVLFVLCYTYTFFALYKKHQRQLRYLLWFEALLVAYLHFTVASLGIAITFTAFWIARLPNSYELRTCLLLAGGACVLYLGALVFHGIEAEGTVGAFLIIPTYLFVLSVTYTGVREERLRLEAIELNRELKAAQLQLAEKSRENERLRIARDMHDLLGHQLTALILNLEVATHKTTGAALAHVEQSLALAKLLLGDLRNAVSELRENPPVPFRTALVNLIANVPELRVTLDMDESFDIQDAQAAEALLRCIQEALTNTLRHANAHICVIRVYSRGHQVVLEIEDDGRSAATITPGNGLNGMKERIEALAGSLRWQNNGGSFFLQAQLPVAGALP